MSDHKDRVRAALERHHSKLANKQKRFKKNGKPEKAVEREVLIWARDRGWDVQVLESKAAYNPRAGCFVRSSAVSVGTCDIIGNTDGGVFLAIELKAPGRLSTFASDRNCAQRDYLIAKIHNNAFACVTDSVERLEKIYTTWSNLEYADQKKQYLLGMLPVKKETP